MTENQEAESAPAPEPALDEHGAMSFEDTMRLIASKAAAENGETLEEVAEPAEDPVEAPESTDQLEEQEIEAQGTPEPEPTQETPENEPQVEDKSLARIMERENNLAEKQRAYDEAQTELNELRSRLDRFEGAQTAFSTDPISYIKEMAPDIDLKRLAEGLWNEQLGEKAPADYLQRKAATRQLSERDVRLAKLEQAEQERQQRTTQETAQRELNQYLGSLQTFVESAPTESLPLVTLMQAKDSKMVAASMENIARNHAQQTNGQVLTPEQVAQELEKQLGYYQLKAEPAKAAAPTPEPGASLRNSSTQTQPDMAPDDELSDEFLRAKAFEEMRKVKG